MTIDATRRGAASHVAEAITTARTADCIGTLIVRGDSAYYSGAVVAACRRAGARFSFTVTMDPKVKAMIAAIDEGAWTPIRYPRAIFDEASGQWVSDAQVAEVGYTAFASKPQHRTTARLVVRQVKDLAAQAELFPVWCYHAVFTDNPHELVTAEAEHRDHAIVEQVFADLFDGPLGHLPSGRFAANAAWLTLAALVHNLLRAADALASAFHARARGATLRGTGADAICSRWKSTMAGLSKLSHSLRSANVNGAAIVCHWRNDPGDKAPNGFHNLCVGSGISPTPGSSSGPAARAASIWLNSSDTADAGRADGDAVQPTRRSTTSIQ